MLIHEERKEIPLTTQNQRRSRPKKRPLLSGSNIVLALLILGLGFILGYRTQSYMNQIVVETSDAVLKSGPGIEYRQEGFLKKDQRLTVFSKKYHWLHVRTDDGKTGWVADWMIADGYTNPVSSLGSATIVVDAGHGGADSGALSLRNKKEKKYTLLFAQDLQKKLEEAGAKVYMTRSTDKTVSLSSRPVLAQQVHADAFISIHIDSCDQPNAASGFTTYYYHSGKSYELARCLNRSFGALGLENRGVDKGDFLVIRDNTQPAVLLEMGYINTQKDFESISDPSYRSEAMSDVVKGLKTYIENK